MILTHLLAYRFYKEYLGFRQSSLPILICQIGQERQLQTEMASRPQNTDTPVHRHAFVLLHLHFKVPLRTSPLPYPRSYLFFYDPTHGLQPW